MKKMKKLIVVLLTIAMFANTVSSVSMAAEYDAKDAAIVEDTSEQTSGDQTDEGLNETEGTDKPEEDNNSEDDETNQDSEGTEGESESSDSEENQDSEESGEDASAEETEEEQDSEESEEAEDEESEETEESASDENTDEDAPEVVTVEEETVGAKSSRTAYVKGVSLNLSGKIGIKIYLDCTEVLDGTNDSQKLIDINGETVELGSLETGDGISNMPISYELSAKEMNKEISIKLYDWNGDIIILKNQNKVDDYGDMVEYEDDTFVFKIKDYIDDASVNSEVSDTLRSLMYFMGVYGQKAQQYFDYDLASITEEISATEIPAEKLKNFVKTTTPQNATLPAGLKYYGSSLLLESEITIRHYFSLTGNKEIEDYRFNRKHTDADGDIFYEELSPGCKGSLYYIDVENIPAPKIGEVYPLIVTDDNGGNAWTLNYSAMSYVYDAVNSGRASEKMMNLCKSLYWYYISAADYFGLTNPEDGSGIGLEKDPSGEDVSEEDGPVKTNEELEAEAKYLINYPNESVNISNCLRNNIDNLDRAYCRRLLQFQKDAIKSVPGYRRYLAFEQGGDRDIRIYNTSGSEDGIFIYYGDVIGNDRNSRTETSYVDENGTIIPTSFKDGIWINIKQSDNSNCTVDNCEEEYIIEAYCGDWKADYPNGAGDYYVATVHYYYDEEYKQYFSDVERYDYRVTDEIYKLSTNNQKFINGLMYGSAFEIYYGISDENGPAPELHSYRIPINDNGYYYSNASSKGLESEEGGIIKVKCRKHSGSDNDYMEFDKNTIFKVSGIYISTFAGHTVSGNDVNLDKLHRAELLDYAYDVATETLAGGPDYRQWAEFVEYARQYGIENNKISRRYVLGNFKRNGNATKEAVGVYCGYDSDDIYIYWGDMAKDGDDMGKRVGSGKRLIAKSLTRTEADTGYKDEARYYEVTDAEWVNDSPNGQFSTDIYIEVLTSTKAVTTHKHIEGNMVNGKYNGNISWTIDKSIKYLYLEKENTVNTSNSYSASFNMGTLNADNVDGDGYALVYSRNNTGVYDRLYTGRIFGLSGFKLGGNTADNTIILRLDESEVSPDSSEATLNTVFDMARKLATQNSEKWEWWSTLKTNARAYGITYDNPAISSVLDNGKYIGVYGAYDGKGYYIYYGDMYEGVRTGQGRWISATSYTTASNTATGKYLEDYSGGWSNNRPEGSFRQSNTLWVSKNGKITKVARTYTGNVTDGAFNGVISWDVDTSVTQNNNTLSHTVHSFRANFENGFIMGYKPDVNKYVYVPSVYGSYTEDQIHALKQYIVGGMPATDNAIVSGNSVYKKIVRTVAGKVTYKYEKVNY